jgi:hypothetical protein
LHGADHVYHAVNVFHKYTWGAIDSGVVGNKSLILGDIVIELVQVPVTDHMGLLVGIPVMSGGEVHKGITLTMHDNIVDTQPFALGDTDEVSGSMLKLGGPEEGPLSNTATSNVSINRHLCGQPGKGIPKILLLANGRVGECTTELFKL